MQQPIATPAFLAQSDIEYHQLTAILGIPENTSKDITGSIAIVLGIEIDTNTFEARLSAEKLTKAQEITTKALSKLKLSLFDVQSLSGYLSWCAGVVRLGHIYLCHLWDYIASFLQWATSSFQQKILYNVRLDLA